ncbi:MAG: PhzF family phenazine biosynthesis protein [Clostridiales bacterium]|jgi:PhzF family phenazine biosynthesis protein|nr:PhzF family phenazine biosynthesis protein [Clostridiales bacterium]
MKYFVIDAFADKIFKGNPAGVCLLEKKLDDEILQNIAAENNLSETAFLFKQNDFYDLRWFTPTNEVDLCGHATLASAFVVMNFVEAVNEVHFETKSGALFVAREDDVYTLDFPSNKPQKISVTEKMRQAIGMPIIEAFADFRDLVLVLEDEQVVKDATPDFEKIKQLDIRAVAITAKGDNADFVSRFFAPKMGVPEDPVTGSAHTRLIPLWAEKFEKNEMLARQLSKRGGTLICKNCGERVKIAGKAALYLKGEIFTA